MPIRRQDISVLLLCYFGYSRIRNLLFRLQRRPHTRFVAFHDVIPESSKCFEEKLQFLKKNTNVVSLADFFSGRLSCDKINVVITFDDGFKSWVSHAVPVLKKLSLPATFFVSSGFIDLSKEDEAAFARSNLLIKQAPRKSMARGLSSREIKSIVDNGFTIGGHTLSHCDLSKLNDGVQIEHEIVDDKKRLENVIGAKIEYFAYPLGAYSNSKINIIEILIESGYRGAVTTSSGYNSTRTNRYLLHRELTDASMSERVFKARVYGNYDAVRFIKKRIQDILNRS